MLKVAMVTHVPGALLCYAVVRGVRFPIELIWILSSRCALLHRGSNLPWHPNPDRYQLGFKLELSGRIARPELIAVETL
eukprot:3052930-Pyramimonas_sp.AAC.1